MYPKAEVNSPLNLTGDDHGGVFMKKITVLCFVFSVAVISLFAASNDTASLIMTFKPQVKDESFFGLSDKPIEFVSGGTPDLKEKINEELQYKVTKTVYLGWQFRQSNPKFTDLTILVKSKNGRVLRSDIDFMHDIPYSIALGAMINGKNSDSTVSEWNTDNLTNPTSAASFVLKNTIEKETGNYPLEFLGYIPITIKIDESYDFSGCMNTTYSDTITITVNAH